MLAGWLAITGLAALILAGAAWTNVDSLRTLVEEPVPTVRGMLLSSAFMALASSLCFLLFHRVLVRGYRLHPVVLTMVVLLAAATPAAFVNANTTVGVRLTVDLLNPVVFVVLLAVPPLLGTLVLEFVNRRPKRPGGFWKFARRTLVYVPSLLWTALVGVTSVMALAFVLIDGEVTTSESTPVSSGTLTSSMITVTEVTRPGGDCRRIVTYEREVFLLFSVRRELDRQFVQDGCSNQRVDVRTPGDGTARVVVIDPGVNRDAPDQVVRERTFRLGLWGAHPGAEA